MKGTVYALTNPSMPEVIKIGKTTNLAKRLEKLYSTSVPTQFDCICAVEVEDMDGAEEAMHVTLDSFRVNEKREFFKVNPRCVTSLFSLLTGKDVTPNKEEADVEEQESGELLCVTLPSGQVITGETVKDIIRQMEEGAITYGFAKYSTIISRRDKGWTMEQSFGFEVPPNYTAVDKEWASSGYNYYPKLPTGSDNTKPLVVHSEKRIYISQKHFADAHGIPTDYVSDKLKMGWEPEKIILEYKKLNDGK